METYLRIGSNRFSILPMSYQKLSTETGLHVATIARFGSDDAKQVVGRPSPKVAIEGLMFPKEFGGKAEFDGLRSTQRGGRAVMMMGLSANAGRSFGRVLITSISDDQKEIDVDGLGKMVEFSITVEGLPGSLGQPGGLF